MRIWSHRSWQTKKCLPLSRTSLCLNKIRRSISKFNQYISERNRFLLGDPDYIAKGYKPILTMNEGYADVAYEETPELIEAQNVLRSTNVST